MKDHFKLNLQNGLNSLRSELSAYSNENDIWRPLKGTTNSAGHLTFHLVGNLNHFIGAGIGKTGYIRMRDLEFSGDPVSLKELIKSIDECSETVALSFDHLTDEDLQKEFSLPWREGLFYNTHFMLVQMTLHFNYHLGQINYHRRSFNA